MLICHKRVASNEAAVLQACHVSDVHATMQPHRQCLSCQRRERLCPAERMHHPVLSTTSGFSNTVTRQRRLTTTGVADAVVVPTKTACVPRKIIIIFYIFIFIFCSMCFELFSIVLCKTIVTVYTDNIFLYNYLRQMHQISHLSPVGWFTPARGKTVQKNREVSGAKTVSV